MTPRTAEALEASIRHWEENARAETITDASVGTVDCALCNLFFWKMPRCHGCPVAEKTKREVCTGTSYYAASDAFYAWREAPNSDYLRTAFHRAAQAEVDFLKSLREVSQ